jgi:phosphoribosylformylglycinamidine cyclo-ligase
VQGARPLFVLDYLATGRLSPDVAEQIVSGVARGCRDNGCALLGGETAEMPGFYADGEYDIAGFVVGIVDRERIVDGRGILPGDLLVGLPSTGLHTNGYSLARRVFFDVCGLKPNTPVRELRGTVGDALLAPHRSYLSAVQPLLQGGTEAAFDVAPIKGMAHITGGGMTDNLPRVLPDGCAAAIDLASWDVPQIFRYLQDRGRIPQEDMFRTFNMGVGLVLFSAAADQPRLLERLVQAGERPIALGQVVPGDRDVRYLQAS